MKQETHTHTARLSKCSTEEEMNSCFGGIPGRLPRGGGTSGVLKNKVELSLPVKEWVGVGKNFSSRTPLASKFVGTKLLPSNLPLRQILSCFALCGDGKTGQHPVLKNFRSNAP